MINQGNYTEHRLPYSLFCHNCDTAVIPFGRAIVQTEGSAQESFIADHASVSLSSDHCALAGLVEGRQTASLCIAGSIYFLNSPCDLRPLQKICAMLQLLRIIPMSFGRAFLMLASEEPVISQLAIESQSARSWLIISSFFSSTVTGTGLSNTEAITFQKRFCGCP